MVKIVLSTGVLDVAETLSLPITFNIGDIRDLSSRKGTFSKTVTLDGTKNNNELLGHYYDVNIQAGTFNINALTKCQVIQNGVPILDEALLQLVSVNKVQSNNSYEDEVTYSVLIKDSRAEFFTAITNAYLTDLDFSDLNYAFDSAAIAGTFNNTVADGYKYLMPYNDTNVFQANDFKPAIYAKTYWDRIFAVAGFTYTWSEIAAAHFDKLLIPYNGDVNNQDYEDYKVEATNTWTTTNVQAVGQNITFQEAIDSGWSELIDTQGIFDPTTGEYTSPISTNTNAGEHYVYSLTIGGTIDLDNTSGGTAALVNSVDFTTGFTYNRYRVFARVRVAGSGNAVVYGSFGWIAAVPGNFLATGITNVLSFSDTFNIPVAYNGTGVANGIDLGDIQILDIGVEVKTFPSIVGNQQPYSINAFWRNSTPPYATPAAVNVVLDLNFINMVILPSNNIQITGGTLTMNQYVPVEIKQSDFVKGILQMYNLYVEQDIDNPYNLVLRHRDEYYDSGAEKDWSEKLAKDRGQDLMFLPDLTKKRLKLTYEADEDTANKLYTQATGEIYGQIEYTFDNEYVKDVETQALLFSPTPVYSTSFGAYLPAINGAAPNTNIRILYDGGEQPCQPFDIVDFGTTGQYGLTDYPMIGHFNNALTPTFDINFGTNDFYFYETTSLTANNLYNLYWRRTVNQINVGKMLTAMFDLNEVDIQSLKLNDKIYIDNSWWNINKIADYNANNNQLTKVELISIDTEIDLAPFKTGAGRPIGDTIVAVGTDAILRTRSMTSNVIMPGADAMVFGKGNTVTAGTRGVVIGDGQTLSDDGMVVSNLTVTGTINGDVVVNSAKYIATISQSGTSDPTVTVLENTIGDIVWTRIAVGRYHGTLSGAFPDQDRLYLYLSNSQQNNYVAIFRVSANIIEIITYDFTNTGQDNMLDYNTIEIRTY
jgi:hypothetical protein